MNDCFRIFPRNVKLRVEADKKIRLARRQKPRDLRKVLKSWLFVELGDNHFLLTPLATCLSFHNDIILLSATAQLTGSVLYNDLHMSHPDYSFIR